MAKVVMEDGVCLLSYILYDGISERRELLSTRTELCTFQCNIILIVYMQTGNDC